MQPLIPQLPPRKLTEEEFYALGDMTLRSRIRPALSALHPIIRHVRGTGVRLRDRLRNGVGLRLRGN